MALGGFASRRNTIIVSQNGGDISTLAQAKRLAVSGDTIVVSPGTYNENNLAKDGVNWWFHPGAIVSYTDPGSGNGFGIFDDRGGAVSFAVGGYGTFLYQGNTLNANCRGAFVLTNANSSLSLQARRISVQTDDVSALTSCLFLLNCSEVYFEVDQMLDDDYDAFILQGQTTGIYWEKGTVRGFVRKIRSTQNCTWTATPDATSQNMYLTVETMQSRNAATVYHAPAAGASLCKTWIRAQEIIGDNASAVYASGNGKLYVVAEKASSGAAAVTDSIVFTGSWVGEAWLTIQKVTASQRALSIAAGTAYVRAEQMEDGSASTPMVSNTGGVLYLSGQVIKVLNGKGISHTGGTSRVSGMLIDTTNTNNAANNPAIATAAGLILASCVLKAPAAAASVAQGGATVKCYPPCIGTIAATATIQGTLTIDANAA